MKRYGYLDMPDDYTDIADYDVKATCMNCGQVVITHCEQCWEEDGHLVTDCMCSELPDDEPEFPFGEFDNGLHWKGEGEPEIHWDDFDRPYYAA